MTAEEAQLVVRGGHYLARYAATIDGGGAAVERGAGTAVSERVPAAAEGAGASPVAVASADGPGVVAVVVVAASAVEAAAVAAVGQQQAVQHSQYHIAQAVQLEDEHKRDAVLLAAVAQSILPAAVNDGGPAAVAAATPQELPGAAAQRVHCTRPLHCFPQPPATAAVAVAGTHERVALTLLDAQPLHFLPAVAAVAVRTITPETVVVRNGYDDGAASNTLDAVAARQLAIGARQQHPSAVSCA